MSQFVTELDWQQRTALRLSTRQALLELVEKRTPGQNTITRSLQAADLSQYGRRRDDRREIAGRLHTGQVSPCVWKRVTVHRLYNDQGVAIWGYAAYLPDSQIDVIRLGTDVLTLAEYALAELVAIQRRNPERVRRRSGWFDPPPLWGPNDVVSVSVLSDAGIEADEPFALLGTIAEAAGRTVLPDWVNRW
jgi:hypothetical protein